MPLAPAVPPGGYHGRQHWCCTPPAEQRFALPRYCACCACNARLMPLAQEARCCCCGAVPAAPAVRLLPPPQSAPASQTAGNKKAATMSIIAPLCLLSPHARQRTLLLAQLRKPPKQRGAQIRWPRSYIPGERSKDAAPGRPARWRQQSEHHSAAAGAQLALSLNPGGGLRGLLSGAPAAQSNRRIIALT